MRTFLTLASVAAVSALFPYDLVTLLQLNPDMSTLVTAVVAGGLVTPLQGKGPFTIFAPDNFAFDHLPPGVLPELLKNITLLDEILTYHVVAGNVSSSQLKDGEQVPTLNKHHSILVNVHPAPPGRPDFPTITLDRDSQVLYPNTFGTNGVYHVIDRVLIPRNAEMSEGLRAVFARAEERAEEALIASPISLPSLNLVQRLQVIPEYSTLVKAVVAAGLAGALSGTGPFTVFAPDNFAFDRLPPGVLPKILANKTELAELLEYHVASGAVASKDLKDGEKIPTLLTGKSILVNLFNETRPTPHTVVILDHHSMVTLPDNVATNGIFHGIDEVILPPKMASKYEISQ